MLSMSDRVVKEIEFRCPDENEAVLADGHYLSLGRDKKGRLLAIITKGHPGIGNGKTEVCDVEIVEDRKAAAAWFAESLVWKPWAKQ